MSALVWLAAVSFAIWVVMALGRGWFWRIRPRLERDSSITIWPSVAVVVPARDEAEMLPLTLPTLLGQRYRGSAKIVLVDDGSEDGTAEVAASLRTPQDELPLEVVTATEHPPGWSGKLWALRCGLERVADAELVLLTDADVAHPLDSLASLVAAAQAGSYDQVSLMAKLSVRGAWERLLVPAFVYFFAMLYPFRWVERSPGRHAAAAGGCLLVRQGALKQAGGVDAVHDAIIDDVSLARALARSGARLWLGYGEEVRSLRHYEGLAELWSMVTRSAFAQLRFSYLALAGTVGALLLTFVAPLGCLACGLYFRDAPATALGGATWLMMSATFLPMQRYYGLAPWRCLSLPLAALLYTCMTVDAGRRHWSGRGAIWKGRRYGPSGAARKVTHASTSPEELPS